MFTPVQHRETAIFLKVSYIQTQVICSIITWLHVEKNPVARAAGKLTGGPGNPLCDVFQALEMTAYNEMPAEQAGKMYFFHDEDNRPAAFLGVSAFLNQQNNVKLLLSDGYHPDTLDSIQMLVIWIFLKNEADRFITLADRIKEAYQFNHPAVKKAKIAAKSIRKLLSLLVKDPSSRIRIPTFRIFEIDLPDLPEMFEIEELEE